jgi:plastocyanin
VRSRTAVPTLVGQFLFLCFSLLILGPARAAGPQATPEHSGHAGMTDAAMASWASAWWSSHPRVGTSSLKAGAATFTVANFLFDADGNAATQVDTVMIAIGDAVTWQWIGGIHSITNGTGSEDPAAGTLFDQPSSVGAQQFTFEFNTAGTFHFFCRPHELNAMMGVVIVGGTTGVKPLAGEALGFTGGPWPNPTQSGVSFGFALRHAGRARAEVFDASGRRIALVLDRNLDAGPHTGAWDGRTLGGAPAENGLYYLRLRLPGYERSRAIAIAR